MNLLRNTPNILKANFAFQELCHFWWCQICSIITWAIRPHAQFPWKTIWQKKSHAWGPYAFFCLYHLTRKALLGKGLRNEANAAMNAFLLRQKNSKTRRSYDKMLIDWVGRVERKDILFSVWTHGPRCATVGWYVQTSSQINSAPVFPLGQ